MNCPGCGQSAPFHSHRARKGVLSLLGPVRLSRAYYYCGRCGKGLCPFDGQAGLTARHLTPAAEEAVSMAGLLTDSFAEAASKVLPRLAGLHLSEPTVERATEGAGARLGSWLDGGGTLGEAEPFDWHKDRQGRTVAYVSVDATGVPQQAPGGGKAEGRMPYVACVYNPPPLPQEAPQAAPGPGAAPQAGAPAPAAQAAKKPAGPMQARYLAGLYALPLLGLLLRKQAAQVGMEQADVWVALSDAGSGLEGFLQQNFNRPGLALVLDFYHPASRLEELARLCQPGDQEQARQQAQGWCTQMKQQGGAALLEHLRAMPPPGGQAARAKHDELLGYLDNHKHKMNYPYYLEQGWHIGSGAVESACKTVVGQRLKLAGMRWGESGTDNVCHLRALFKSDKGQWQAFWARRLNKGSIFYQPT